MGPALALVRGNPAKSLDSSRWQVVSDEPLLPRSPSPRSQWPSLQLVVGSGWELGLVPSQHEA